MDIHSGIIYIILAGCAYLVIRTLLKMSWPEHWLVSPIKNTHRPLIFSGFVIIGLIVFLLAWFVPEWLTKDSGNLTENRKSFIQLLGGIAISITAYYSWQRVKVSDRQVQAIEDGQITERYTKAIEQLGNDNMTIRIGGIFALERIAKDSVARYKAATGELPTKREHAPDYHTVIEVLTGFIREKSPLEKKITVKATDDTEVKASESTEAELLQPIPQDIQAALTVLGRRDLSYENGEDQQIDLTKCNLKNARLEKSNFSGAYLMGADLPGAYFAEANLRKAFLIVADLRGVNLNGADLRGADLRMANLEGAKLVGANLEEAYLEGAYLEETNLEGANLERADLGEANLKKTNLEGAKLKGAKLKGANLSEAIFDDETQITFEQLCEVKTLYGVEGLPAGLEQQLRETKPELFEDRLFEQPTPDDQPTDTDNQEPE